MKTTTNKNILIIYKVCRFYSQYVRFDHNTRNPRQKNRERESKKK